MAALPRVTLLLAALLLAAGCTPAPRSLEPSRRSTVDRRSLEYPTGLEIEVVGVNFTAATALTTGDGYVYVADRGARDSEVRITRINHDTGESAEIYPARRAIVSWFDQRPRLYGPVGGMAFRDGELYVTARDEDDAGLVAAFDLNGWTPADNRPPVRIVVAQLPARGDHGVTDITFHPLTGRLFFGVGSATNSGVVGVDNWEVGWPHDYPEFRDLPLTELKIYGYRFDTEDPAAGLLNPDKVNTAPFNAFGESAQRIRAAPDGKPTAAIYSIDPRGGDLRVEAHGIRNPAGLAFNSFANLWATNQGMELRGTRPVKDDPDTLLRVFTVDSSAAATWYGWPDYSTDLRPIIDARLQPPRQLLARTGYSELSFLIDHANSGTTARASGLAVPDRDTLVTAVFRPLSGASGATFVPENAPGFEPYAGQVIVALRGDRAPFATSGLPLKQPQGRQVVVVDTSQAHARPVPFIFNNAIGDSDSESALIRPVDVTFDADGVLWVLDQGNMSLRNGVERFRPGTGRLFRLAPAPDPATQPAE